MGQRSQAALYEQLADKSNALPASQKGKQQSGDASQTTENSLIYNIDGKIWRLFVILAD